MLTGHTDRLARTAWHPGGGLIATASYDTTWRLWDAERGQCLLEQEGHSRGVYAVAFQGDGALVASAGLDAIGEQTFGIKQCTCTLQPEIVLHAGNQRRRRSPA